MQDGLSALHLALQTASDEARSIAERLLSHGADVNAATPGGDTALHLVSAWSDELLAEEVALCLLHYGADVDWRNTVDNILVAGLESRVGESILDETHADRYM